MKQAVASAIRKYGEPVEIYPRVGQSSLLTGSVQRPNAEQVINDMDADNFVVYVAADDVAQAPLKFDRIRLRGDMRTINEVQTETYEGQTMVYVLRVQG